MGVTLDLMADQDEGLMARFAHVGTHRLNRRSRQLYSQNNHLSLMFTTHSFDSHAHYNLGLHEIRFLKPS